jgi:hypothetical protein
MITPSNFLTNNHLDRLRRLILELTTVEQIVVVDEGVFHGISVDNAIFMFVAGKRPSTDFSIIHARTEAGKLV